MRVLWITNILFPEAQQFIFGEGVLRSSGGWMLAAAESLIVHTDFKLFVATVSSSVVNLKILKGKQITYYVLPLGHGNLKYNSEYETYWQQIQGEVQPDVVHIHGTEYTHGMAYVKVCGNKNVVVSVQGLKSGIAPYYLAGLSYREILSNLTLRDVFKGTLYQEQRAFYRSGKLEREFLCCVNHVIGRTSWDRSHIWAINPKAHYHFCNEMLRTEFYDGVKWNYDKCEPHTIFLSQGSYPLKGLHQVLRAMPLILHRFPDAMIRVAGGDVSNCQGLSGLLHFTGYGRMVRKMIKQLHIKDRVTFLGPLTAAQMKEEYLRSNVFVCPSSIENSPNSLGEAQILGVPCVASYVGGVPDMMQGNEENLYRFEEIEMLSRKICNVFAFPEKQRDLSEIAKRRHDCNTNINTLLNIYNMLK